MELYNEELTDLLSLNDSDKDKRLRLLEDRSGVVVQGLEEVVVKSAAGGEQAAWTQGCSSCWACCCAGNISRHSSLCRSSLRLQYSRGGATYTDCPRLVLVTVLTCARLRCCVACLSACFL